jgi:hypothetical protein
MSEPRFAEEIDALGDDNELTNYALEKFVEEGLAEKFALFYDSNEIKKLAFEINKAVSATGDSEKEKMNRAFGEAMATKIFEMIKASK